MGTAIVKQLLSNIEKKQLSNYVKTTNTVLLDYVNNLYKYIYYIGR